IAIKLGYYTIRCIRKFWCASTDQPKVVQERATEGPMEEVIAKRVLLGQFPFRIIGRVIVAHNQTCRITPRHKLGHLSAINLQLFLVEAVYEVAGRLIRSYVL